LPIRKFSPNIIPAKFNSYKTCAKNSENVVLIISRYPTMAISIRGCEILWYPRRSVV